MRNLSDDASIQEIACPVEKLDDFVARERLQVDFIKCDVEGAELMVLRGASATLDQAQPVVFLEMLRKWAAKFNYHPNDIIDYLQGKGYQCHAVLGDRLVTVPEVTEDTVATNYVFLHGRKHRALAERLVDQKPR
jgi:hypothetical protein